MISSLVGQIAAKKLELTPGSRRRLQDAEQILRAQGLKQVKEDAFVKIAAKVQRYIDLSLELRKKHPEFEGLPPTELATNENGELVPMGLKTEAIDQQRQLYAPRARRSLTQAMVTKSWATSSNGTTRSCRTSSSTKVVRRYERESILNLAPSGRIRQTPRPISA